MKETIKTVVLTLGVLVGFFVMLRGIIQIFKHLIKHYQKSDEGHFYEAFKVMIKTFVIFFVNYIINCHNKFHILKRD